MTTLFETSGRLSPIGSRSHICFTVFLQEPIDRLVLDFSYSPKFLSDPAHAAFLRQEAETRYFDDPRFLDDGDRDINELSNLLTLSFDDARGFRGAAHRHAAEQHLFLGKDTASPGLLVGAIPIGRFRVTLSVHAVVTETCNYLLSIFSEKS